MRLRFQAGSLYPIQALRLGLRSLRGNRAPALTAALTLSIGFGAAAAIFSVMRGFSQALPVPDGGRIIRLGRPRAMARGFTRLLPSLVLGFALTYLAAPYFALFFSGVDPRDPLSFSAVVLGYLLVAMIATLAPAWRAASLDPARVLGSD